MSSTFNDPDVARHLKPLMGTDNCFEVAVDLSAHGMAGKTELLWVQPAHGDDHVVACIPFFTYGIHFGDLVSVDLATKTLLRVLRPCGLRTMRIAFTDDARAHEVHKEVHGLLMECGLPHEWRSAGYLSIVVRNKDDQEMALSVFRPEFRAQHIQWEVDPEPFE